MKAHTPEARAPLFDRLIDRDRWLSRESVPLRTLDRRGLEESVRRELERLFNTRCPVPAPRLEGRERTVIDYGIPDLSGYSALRTEDCEALARQMRRAIAAYEPRLAEVRVQLEPSVGDALVMTGSITALLRIGSVAEPVSFTTLFQMKEGEVEVHAGA